MNSTQPCILEWGWVSSASEGWGWWLIVDCKAKVVTTAVRAREPRATVSHNSCVGRHRTLTETFQLSRTPSYRGWHTQFPVTTLSFKINFIHGPLSQFDCLSLGKIPISQFRRVWDCANCGNTRDSLNNGESHYCHNYGQIGDNKSVHLTSLKAGWVQWQ